MEHFALNMNIRLLHATTLTLVVHSSVVAVLNPKQLANKDGSRDKITMSITSDEQLALIGDAAEYRQVEHSECIQLTLCSSN